MIKYTILGSHNDYCRVMCYDVLNLENIYFENEMDLLNNKILKFIRRIHFSYKINKIIKLPFKSLWYSTYINKKKLSVHDENVFLVFDSNCHVYDKEFLDYIKYKYKSKVVLILFNTIASIKNHDVNFFLGNYDYIFTTDPKDSQKYGFEHFEMVYSKYNLKDVSQNNDKSDLFFVGANKNRLGFLHKIAEYMIENNVKHKFYITDVLENKKKENISVIYNKRIDYIKVLDYVNSSKCLLEIVQDGQQGVTLRTIEAIVYNKKLLTNNLSIKESKLYNQKYMQVFTDLNEIDIEFIKKEEEVKYEYNDQYSPSQLISKINYVINKNKVRK